MTDMRSDKPVSTSEIKDIFGDILEEGFWVKGFTNVGPDEIENVQEHRIDYFGNELDRKYLNFENKSGIEKANVWFDWQRSRYCEENVESQKIWDCIHQYDDTSEGFRKCDKANCLEFGKKNYDTSLLETKEPPFPEIRVENAGLFDMDANGQVEFVYANWIYDLRPSFRLTDGDELREFDELLSDAPITEHLYVANEMDMVDEIGSNDTLIETFVAEGDTVKKDQPIFAIYTPLIGVRTYFSDENGKVDWVVNKPDTMFFMRIKTGY